MGIVVLGECMVELSFSDPATAAVGYAGDTFNTAVYLSRLGRRVAYATAVGKGDRFSDGMLRLMAEEGIARDLVVEVEGRLPGLYAIERDAAGERSFHYWRSEAPVRDFLQLADLGALAAAIREAEVLYLSGITLAVIGEAGRGTLAPLLAQAQAVAFDLNYRPGLWPNADAARAAAEGVASLCAYVFVGDGEAESLYGVDAARTIDAWSHQGVEVVARAEDRSVRVLAVGGAETFPPGPVAPVVDTTGAGDAFNAAYLDARLGGRRAPEAVRAARALATKVVAQPGAVIRREAMS